MFSYNNTHIFTGYLKQMLSSFNLPSCKIYTREYAKYLEQHGEEDPRVLESFDSASNHGAVRINYLKNNDLYNYFLDKSGNTKWKHSTDIFYSPDKAAYGLTRSLNSVGKYYDTSTHEYLGDYLRFIRDYYNLNLMSMYNCFNNKIYNNIYFNFVINPDADKNEQVKVTFDSQDSSYKIYAIPVKLFSQYTIALDCSQGIEMFCGLYNTRLELSAKANILAAKTYVKINQTLFNQPFLYDMLAEYRAGKPGQQPIAQWTAENDIDVGVGQQQKAKLQFSPAQIRSDIFTRWDITNREKDLRLFIKVPVSCKSSIVILEGDYRGYNDAKYLPSKKTIAGSSSLEKTAWNYSQNHTMLNFNTTRKGVMYNTASGEENFGDGIDLNEYYFKPISKLQLLAFNTGESYPFADRLVEYLSGSAITQMDEIPDNIKRVQCVMAQNKNYFKIEGLWENKIQNILYDYMINSGPIIIGDKKLLVDKRTGTHPTLGYTTKSTMYDILGYVDKDTEKLYASWKRENGRAVVKDTIQNVDVYDGLYDI
jgi:hypothetical protein